jgi:transposase
VLACAEGASNQAVADRLGISRPTATKWRSRFVARRLEGLADEPRPGAARTITDEQVEQVLVTTLETTPADATHWSTRSLARQLGMSQSAISRIWRAFGLKPHLVERWFAELTTKWLKRGAPTARSLSSNSPSRPGSTPGTRTRGRFVWTKTADEILDRGAGAGSFGVVTSLVFRAVPVPNVTNFHLAWPFPRAVAIIEAWQGWAPVAPDELAASLKVTAAGAVDQPASVDVYEALLGTESDAAELLKTLVVRAGSDPISASAKHMSFPETRNSGPNCLLGRTGMGLAPTLRRRNSPISWPGPSSSSATGRVQMHNLAPLASP